VTTRYSIFVTRLIEGATSTLLVGANGVIFAHESYKIKVELHSSYKNTYKNNIRWDFGDGTVVVGPTATHYYKTPGKYNISCTLYKLNDTPVENAETHPIIVKEIIPSELKFLGIDKSWQDTISCCKNNNLGKIQVTISNNISSEPRISAIRRWKNGDTKEPSYFDISSNIYYHRDKYYTFLEKQEVRSIGSIDSNFIQSFLRPVTSYKPEYIEIYGYFSCKPEPNLNAYIIGNTDIDEELKLDMINPKGYNGALTANRTPINIIHIKDKKDMPAQATLIGKVAIIDIWYKNDFVGERNDLIFEFDKDTFKFKNEPASSEFYLNIPPLGKTVHIGLENKESNLIQALTSNGLFNSEYIFNSDKRFSIVSEPALKIENHLIYNLYLDYEIEVYNSYFILNDSLENGDKTYNLYKQSRPLYELKTDTPDNLKLIEVYDDSYPYIDLYRIKPISERGFRLQYKTNDNETINFLSCNKITSLEKLVLPSEKQSGVDGRKVLETYMQHPMYDDTPNLKIFLDDIFNRNNMLSYITTKGLNILNDNVNYKTCYLNKFLSILEMMDEPATYFDMSSFDKINDLKELVRILTMNYSDLFGNVLSNEFDIRIGYTYKGYNVGEQLEPNDVYLCEIINDEDGSSRAGDIVAIRRGKKILPLSTKTPYLVLKDDFSFETSLVGFVGVTPSSIETFEDQTEEWKAKHEWTELYAFDLNDYNKSWGWVLNLPEEFTTKDNKPLFIDAYYSLYLFNPNTPQIRKYNFLSENTIPKVDGKQISVEDWNDDYGFAYDCLMKILTYNLNLRDSN
jgi:hypothetical protein